jgi:excinuclease ABC subunit A
MGPEGGDGGGVIVAQGTPEDVIKSGAGHTARFLKDVMKRRPAAVQKKTRKGIAAE